MLNFASPTLDDLVFLLLAKEPGISAATLLARLKHHGRQCSVQALYYVLRKLIKSGAVIRTRGRFSVSLAWTLQLMSFSEGMLERSLTSSSGEALPAQGEYREWSFTSLLRLDDFWVQLMLLTLSTTGAKAIINWCPHPWFYFAQASKLEQFYRVLRKQKRKFAVLLGGRTYLDRLFASSVSPELYTCHFAARIPTRRVGYHLMVIDEYVIEVTIDRRSSGRIVDLFNSVKTLSVSEYQRVQRVLADPVRARLKIRRDVEAAQDALARLEKCLRR